ncbi:HD domain-containing phosphohydrolase [Candidatus Magnetomonas plexicatena]|uniref:HD domain-containing phosphohydrolase n=1 Tax=Candidatus Magnetomonas plexicatena TaxID=2552947 RepID=UPI001C7460F5|nr:HD domain-containing protein [Nitrospirales bacterium LBB_01]
MKMRVLRLSGAMVGKPLDRPLYDENGQLMLGRGYVVTDKDIARISRALVVDAEGDDVIPEEDEDIDIEKIVDSDLPFENLDLLSIKIDGLFENLTREKEFQKKIRNSAKIVQDVCSIDEDLALGTIMLEHDSRYTVKHPIHTAIVCEIVAKKQGWSQEGRSSLICAALTMNVGMVELQERLHFQEEALSPYQKEEINRHPLEGVKLLKRLGITDDQWLTAVLQHHEMLDGTGYPSKLKDKAITEAARVIALADIYCARVSGRYYRQPLLPTVALKELFLNKNDSLDPDLSAVFIKNLGIYPPGTYVQLANNEMAIVTQRGERINAPIAYTVLRSNNTVPTVAIKRDTSLDEFAVKTIVPPSKVKVVINRYQLWGYGAFKRPKVAKRKQQRVQVTIAAKVLELATISTYDAVILNISQKGCFIRIQTATDKEFQYNKEFYITFRLLNRTMENIQAMSRTIQRKTDHSLIGMEFIELSTENSGIIKTFLNSQS